MKKSLTLRDSDGRVSRAVFRLRRRVFAVRRRNSRRKFLVDELRERRRARDGALGDSKGRDSVRDVRRVLKRAARVVPERRRRRFFARWPLRYVRSLRERDQGVGDVVFVAGARARASRTRLRVSTRARRARVTCVVFRGVPSSRARDARERTRRLPEHAHVQERVFLGIATRRRRNAGTQARGRAPTREGGHGGTNARASKSPSHSVAFAPRRVG